MSQYAYAPGNENAEFAVRKQRVIDSLTDCYSRDILSVGEYEQRVEKAQTAKNDADLDAVIQDLPAGAGAKASDAFRSPGQGPAKMEQANPSSYSSQGQQATVFCLLGGQNMAGARLSKGVQVFSVMGGATLDFRNTPLPAGETKVDVFALMGGVEIIVPPGLAVHSNLIPIMGGMEMGRNVKSDPYPGEPYLSVAGVVVMGGVEVKARN